MSYKLLWLPFFVWMEPILIFHFLFYVFIIIAVVVCGTVLVKWIAGVDQEFGEEIDRIIHEIRYEDDQYAGTSERVISKTGESKEED